MSLVSSWWGPFLFIRYFDGHGFLDHDEGGKVCVIKSKDDQMWDIL
jgi:hypothetical protein